MRKPVSASQLHRNDGLEFEEAVSAAMAIMCWGVKSTPYSGDRGIDLICTALWSGTRLGIECKDTSAPIGPEPIRSAFAAMHHYDLDRVMVVARSGSFTAQAAQEAAGLGVGLASLHSLFRDETLVGPHIEQNVAAVIGPGLGGLHSLVDALGDILRSKIGELAKEDWPRLDRRMKLLEEENDYARGRIQDLTSKAVASAATISKLQSELVELQRQLEAEKARNVRRAFWGRSSK